MKVETDEVEDAEEDDESFAASKALAFVDANDGNNGNAVVTTAGIADAIFAYFALCIFPPRFFSRKEETKDGEEEDAADAATIMSLRPVTNDTGGLDDADEEDVVEAEAEVEEFENSDSEATDLDLLFCCLAYLAGSICLVVERDVVGEDVDGGSELLLLIATATAATILAV